MPYKSIQGPFVLSLALAALVAGASGAPQLDDVRKQAAQPLRPQSTHTASQVSRDGGIDTALAPIERDLARLRRYEPLAASDMVTNSIDGADSTIALRGSIGNGDALSYSLAVAPRHGRVTIENGRATYRPDPDFVGVDTYTYRVHAGQDSAEAVVAVTSIRERSLPATAAAAL
ncbi:MULTISPECIES: Ig-like domain-containing protein [Lysobacter]|uniref:Ig-like domain-containing protein n=1 Tax=Lysobacter TaxID=68 RepID=UPI001F1ACBE1|nr:MULTISPECIES: Ig-like domain-containing protein [Lysobacter]UJB17193.1 Ig-like domain-containing protein [Lysobacter capsici]UJQ29084.1 Ig-like domain-containing protein [Lysobacter gummosus]